MDNMEILVAIVFVILSSISIILFTLAYRIYKIPNHIWEANRRNPCQDNFNKILDYL